MKTVYQKNSPNEPETLEKTAETTEDSKQLQLLAEEYSARIAKKASKDDQTFIKMLEARLKTLEEVKSKSKNA